MVARANEKREQQSDGDQDERFEGHGKIYEFVDGLIIQERTV